MCEGGNNQFAPFLANASASLGAGNFARLHRNEAPSDERERAIDNQSVELTTVSGSVMEIGVPSFLLSRTLMPSTR